MKKLVFLMIILPLLSHALEVDEKLTVRIVKTSESKKTVMINRGTEDGLVEGNHAKFIVTAGIVGRAVCVKVSPTRSIWSVYRLVNADFILNDAVMTIKITPAVKITKDETQSLVQEDTPDRTDGDPSTLGIPLADGAQDIKTSGDDALSKADIKALEDNTIPTTIVEKNFEVFGIVNISALSASTSREGTDFNQTNSQANHHVGLGGEWYPRREREWYSSFSLVGNVAFVRLNNQAYNGSSSTNDLTELDVGINWHPFTRPSLAHEFIPFFHTSVHMGAIKSTYRPGAENVNGQTISANGGTSGISLGFGYKFYSSRGIGARAMVDYYLRNEKYRSDALDRIYSKSVRGPRLLLGISYRF